MLDRFNYLLHLHLCTFPFSAAFTLGTLLVEMDKKSVLPTSMPGNTKIEDKGQLTQVPKENTDQSDVYEVDYSFLKIVKKLIYAPVYLIGVLLAATIYPENRESFIYCSFISMLLDPLFLYVPLINEETKCLMLDKKVMIAALILRVVTDLRYVAKIRCNIKKWWGGNKQKQPNLKTAIASNMVAILPIPQVAILLYLPNMRGSGSMTIMKFLNSLIIFQYLQRVYPIYRYCKNLNKEMHNKCGLRPWIPSLVNLLIYLLASYVLGTFWYYFSIQREIDCWEYACQREVGCEFSVHCNVNTFRNVTLLHTSCPINPSDATKFDFGIFLYALQSGLQESTNLPQKFLQCFSWGLRNLSSFASNLNTSTYGWETLFVVAISISGLILFIYFLGHVQTFMQVARKSERSSLKLKKILGSKVEAMLSEYGLSPEEKVLTNSINYVIEKKHSEDPDLVLDNMFSIFSFKHKVDDQRLQDELNMIRASLFLGKLKKLDLLPGLNEVVLKEICKHLDPVIYPKGKRIIREGEPIDMMFFITQGIALSYTSNTTDHLMTTVRLEKGECYGEELLKWAETASTSLSDLTSSLYTVKAHKDVELFAIQAADLQRILSQPPNPSNDLPRNTDSKAPVSLSIWSQLRDILMKPGWLTLNKENLNLLS